jgi:hypothetical protein
VSASTRLPEPVRRVLNALVTATERAVLTGGAERAAALDEFDALRAELRETAARVLPPEARAQGEALLFAHARAARPAARRAARARRRSPERRAPGGDPRPHQPREALPDGAARVSPPLYHAGGGGVPHRAHDVGSGHRTVRSGGGRG